MICAVWNVRGLNKAHKQAAVYDLAIKNKVVLLGLVETKLNSNHPRILLSNHFNGWKSVNNFDLVSEGRILLLWNPIYANILTVGIEKQVIHTRVTCLLTNTVFLFALVYGFWTTEGNCGTLSSSIHLRTNPASLLETLIVYYRQKTK